MSRTEPATTRATNGTTAHSPRLGREDDGLAAPRRTVRRRTSERQKTAEEFAREHDPEQHDVAAGEEFRQEGDWTADEAGGPQVWDNEGNLVEGSAPGQSDSTQRRRIGFG